MGTHSGGITLEALPPGATLSDKLRLAASKGQINEVQELYRAGAVFDFDRVYKFKLLIMVDIFFIH